MELAPIRSYRPLLAEILLLLLQKQAENDELLEEREESRIVPKARTMPEVHSSLP
jgi:hypothetical protein